LRDGFRGNQHQHYVGRETFLDFGDEIAAGLQFALFEEHFNAGAAFEEGGQFVDQFTVGRGIAGEDLEHVGLCLIIAAARGAGGRTSRGGVFQPRSAPELVDHG
jgi:hypothetical protein